MSERALTVAVVCCSAASLAAWSAQSGCSSRPAESTHSLRSDHSPTTAVNPRGFPFPTSAPHISSYALEDAFPELRFLKPVDLEISRNDPDTAYLLQQDGTVYRFRNHPDARDKQRVIDLSAQTVKDQRDAGAHGIALHPDFGVPGSANAGELFIFYMIPQPGAAERRSPADYAETTYLQRLSVFDMSEDSPRERVLIEQLDRSPWHNGGDLEFGPDGFLYLSLGDEGGQGDYFQNSQRIDRNFFGGVLRIDVDRRGGAISHPPRRQPVSGKTQGYFIPSDNPFVGRPDALEEFWALGSRSPHRIAFDPQGRLWVGDVGEERVEAIYRIDRGGANMGWSYREGGLPFTWSHHRGKKPADFIGHELFPIHSYIHSAGNTCVIGGRVYSGAALPGLHGRYLFGDNTSGRIWALELDDAGQQTSAALELAKLDRFADQGISSFAQAPDGDLFVLELGGGDRVTGSGGDGRVLRVVTSKRDRARLPSTLSQTGLFADLASLTPAPGVIPYEINIPFYSDGAHKARWIALPPGPRDSRIYFSSDAAWEFPPGTIFVKHFELSTGEHSRWLETRVLVAASGGGAYGVSYRWNDEQTDAALVTAGADIEIPEAAMIWRIPSSSDCSVCHTSRSPVLGVHTAQLNRAEGSVNQLERWNELDMFRWHLPPGSLASVARYPDLDDATVPVKERAQAYLEVNCGHCHQDGALSRARFDASRAGSIDALIGQRAINFRSQEGLALVQPGDPERSAIYIRMHSVEPAERMPPLARTTVDLRGTLLLSRWIESLTSSNNQ